MELGVLDIDWYNLCMDDLIDPIPPAPEKVVSGDSWIGEIEKVLMKDDDDDDNHVVVDDDFTMWEFLLDSPEISDKNFPSATNSNSDSEANVNVEGDLNRIKNDDGKSRSPNFGSKGDDSKDGDTDDNDPLSKKRKRQLSNKDAAMRSRERKKMYVKDLEVKSRYLEAECRRLGRLLQCCSAENQMLRISLQSGSTFAMSKPESAVLSPESLLLGSLVWLMALMCLLLSLPILLTLPSQRAIAPGISVQRRNLGNAAQRKRKGNKPTELWLSLSFMKTKKCRASRTKMKSNFACLVAVV